MVFGMNTGCYSLYTRVSGRVKGFYENAQRERDWSKSNSLNAKNPDSIFLWVPKTAGTTLFSYLQSNHGQQFLDINLAKRYFRNKGIVTFGHIGLPQLLDNGVLDREFLARAWKFAFVRNPYDRAVSLFEYLRSIHDLPETTTFSIFCRYLLERAFKPVGDYNHWGLNQLNPQSSWLLDQDGKPWADFVGRFEQFDQDFAVVSTRLNLQNAPQAASQVKLNYTTRKGINEYYSSEEVKIVKDVYASDFEHFEYDEHPYW